MDISKELKEKGFIEIEVRIRQVGNVVGITIPANILSQMDAHKGDFLKGFIKVSKKLVDINGGKSESK